MKQIVFYYDIVCPYAYLASTRIEMLATRAGVKVKWVPILLGGVFRAIGSPDGPAQSPARQRLGRLDLGRYADYYGVPLTLHPQHPLRTVEAMRLCHTVDGAERVAVTRALYRAYFVEERDPSSPEVLAEVAAEVGRPELVRQIDAPEVKDALRRATDEAVADGVFGVPTFVVVGDDGSRKLYFGQDRLHLFLDDESDAPTAAGVRPSELRFFYDYSSPYSYLAATQVERLARAHGAVARWRPFLLGALFKNIGTPVVPLATFPEAKRLYFQRDLFDWAEHWKVELRWPSRFPMRTLLPLRLTLAVDEAVRPALSLAIYRAYWVEDRDIADPAVLGAIAAQVGVGREALQRAESDPAVKQALIDNGAEAERAGACGAPSFLVGDQLFWGQDRLHFVSAALGGWSPRPV
jgi:2-hydroxychromene-2-carboxylate isomerase